MSSRQEEKERRRQERLAKEQEEARAAAARARYRLVAGSVLGVAAIGAVVVAIAAGGGGGGGSGGGDGPQGPSDPVVPIPAQRIGDLAEAAKAAGCEIINPPEESRDHTTDAVDYKQNPPTSGAHNPVPAQDGDYSQGTPPDLGQSVHALEHGRINVQYAPGTPKRRVQQLQTLFSEQGGYHMLLFQNQTNMPFAVAATAWNHRIGCPEFNDRVFDALRAFRDRWIDQGPETAA